MNQNITIIGAGSWGSALARIASDNGCPVMLYDVDQPTIDEINTHHTNLSKLPNGVLSELVTGTTDIQKALDFSHIILLVVPTKVLRMVLETIKPHLRVPKLFVNASKGLEPMTYKRVSEVVTDVLGNDLVSGFVALTGPSHAEEVIQQMLTVVCSASESVANAKLIQKIFSNQQYFRVYTSEDVVGAELGGALKNIIALASGILVGLGYGDNARAALVTRGLVEIQKIALSFGAKEATLFGLTGLGDLVVTCYSEHSRNFQAGKKIGSGKDLIKVLNEMTMVVEGARTCEAAYFASKARHLETPIIDTVYRIIYLKHEPHGEIMCLMKRSLKSE
ncbi:MAG: NAD(P)H-dependent glycerol-3-phosphate dehydrogenase [Bacilli bacterium]